MNGITQAKRVKKKLVEITMLSPEFMYVRGPKKAEAYHGITEAEAVLCAEEVPPGLLERVCAVLCEPGSWDIDNVVALFYGDNDLPRAQWEPTYPRGAMGRAEYCGLGTGVFTLYIGPPGEPDMLEEEIDVEAKDEKEAREMAKIILPANYGKAMVLKDIVGPRVGLYF